MAHILTFVASSKPLTDAHIRKSRDIAAFYNVKPVGVPEWLAKGKAADLILPARPPSSLLAHLRDEFSADAIDILLCTAAHRRKKLLLADMESTIVDKEALDELAGYASMHDKIAEITHKAMEGKLDFRAALNERVGLLKGLSADLLQKVLDSMNVNPGAEQMIRVMKQHGATCVLVSGGFTFFTGAIAKKAGFDHHHGNTLDIENGLLAGTVAEPILDKSAKLDFLKKYAANLDLTAEDVLAVGDGANDIPMLKAAGLGIGYQPKEAVAQEIDSLIIHGDFTAALYAQGYTDKDF